MTALAFSADGTLLATAGVDGTARLGTIPRWVTGAADTRDAPPGRLPGAVPVGEARAVLQPLPGRVWAWKSWITSIP